MKREKGLRRNFASYERCSEYEQQKLSLGYKRIKEYKNFYLYGRYDREGNLLYRECFSKFDIDGVPVQKLLRGAHHRRRSQSGDAGHLQPLAAGDDGLHPVPADAQAGGEDQESQEQGSHALEAGVPVGMVVVRLLVADADADHGDQGVQHVGGGIHRIGDQAAGMGQKADDQLQEAEGGVGPQAHQGHPLGGFCIVHGPTLLSCAFLCTHTCTRTSVSQKKPPVYQ